jgi:glycosyltransferase involved in cell wall biosynthesis
VLGGSLYHPGGIESFCERTVTAINRHGAHWRATWWATDTAYLSWSKLRGLARAWRRLKTIDRHEVDLVWLQWSTLADLIFLHRVVGLGVPVLATPHLGANARLQRHRVLRALCKRLLARADRLALLFDDQAGEIALPDLPRSTLGTFLPEETLATPPPARDRGALRLLHAGRLSREKGTFRLVEICAELRARGTPFEAKIVGRAAPEVMNELRAEIAQAGLDDAIALAGWMDSPALRDALGHADVLVHLSQLDSFPLIVMEALAAGAIPIVSDMAGASSMVRRYDGLVTQGSNVNDAVEWLINADPDDVRRRGGNVALRVRADNAWPKVVKQLETIADAATYG